MTEVGGPLSRVALAISAYRSDEPVFRLLETAFAHEQPRFAAVIVIDSLGTGAIAAAAERNDWPITYINADRNLGSAGNLELRLRSATELGLDWCLALNHDGELDPQNVCKLLHHGESRSRVGAVYPQLIFPAAGNRAAMPRRRFTTYGVLRAGDGSTDAETCVEVAWSSSNGALYRLDAIRDGVNAWPQLWMGYEDLAIGWELKQRGWVQLLCRDVRVSDNYEFSSKTILGWNVHLAAKPSWYMYYHLRNLLLIAKGTRGGAVSYLSILGRMIIDVALILLYRDHKRERMRLLFRGIADGIHGIGGKGPVP